MKKWMMFFLCALLMLLPLSATAESLPEVLGAVSKGLAEGFTQFPDQDLSLTLSAKDTRIEEGRTLLLTITAENPYPAAADVELTLALPDRLSCAQSAAWQAQLAPASVDASTGALTPSVTTFTREVTLTPDSGESESAQAQVEMRMGTRFYRADAPLELCVPVISASAEIEGAQDGRLLPGEPFALLLHLKNDGNAPKDVPFTLALPEGVDAEAALPPGVVLRGRALCGTLRAEAGSSLSLRLPLITDAALLNGDEDASRLLPSVLTVDGERIPAPMLRIVGPMISAKLTPQGDALKEGDAMTLTITVVNSGLAPADVELSCLLPEGLSALLPPENTQEKAEKSSAIPASAVQSPLRRTQDGALVYAVHMDAAQETKDGIAAAAKEITLRVRADAPLDEVSERLLGASLSWRTDEESPLMSEAAALRVYQTGFMGLDSAEWNGILLAALLMLVTVCCLYTAVRADSKQEDYCFD